MMMEHHHYDRQQNGTYRNMAEAVFGRTDMSAEDVERARERGDA